MIYINRGLIVASRLCISISELAEVDMLRYLNPMHVLLGLFVAQTLTAVAQEHGTRGMRGGSSGAHLRVEPWHGEIRQFHERDMPAWRGGHWYHGPHAGQDGWWWIVGLTWYWYPTPIYPYPDPYLPPAAAAIGPPTPSAPPQYWYYCVNPPGYYPYVPQCYGNWERVPAGPP